MEYFSENLKETQEIGKNLAEEIKKRRIFIIKGDLGAGKTTLVQGFAKGLGITQKVNSPTFILMNKYPLKKNKFLYHLDLYRINKKKELESLDIKELINNKNNIVIIEWPEKIKDILPKDTVCIEMKVLEENKRKIIIKYGE